MSIAKLIQDKLYFEAILLLTISLLSWFILFKLSFRILGERMPLKRIYPAIILMAAFVSARSFIPPNIFMFLMVGLMIISLALLGRLGLYRSMYSAVITFFVSFLGNIFIESVFMAANPKLVSFFFGSILGGIAGSVIEVIFPLLAFLVFPRFSLRLPLRTRDEPYDFYDMVMLSTLGCMFYAFIILTGMVYSGFVNNSPTIALDLRLLFTTTFGIDGGVILILKAMKTRYEKDIKNLLTENQRLEAETKKLLAKLKSNSKTNTEIEQFMPIVNEFITQIAPVIVDLYGKGKKPSVIINEANLRKFDLNSKDGLLLSHIVLDKPYQQIADEIHFSESTLRSRASDMFKKLNLKNREELAKFAIDNHLVEIANE